MIKLLTVIGARPQIIKAAAISRAVRGPFSGQVEEKILHTGQHYDANMSDVFFGELGIPQPDFNLGVGSGRHGEQTARMIAGIEAVLLQEHFDGVILYGDTNSTLAGAVAASKLHVPVFHVEAGLRSFNMAMPEEVNRIVCDQLSSILFAPTETACRNLMREGFGDSPARFPGGKKRLVCRSGDVMYDNSLYFSALAQKRSRIFEQAGVAPEQYILATIHRDHNTDEPARLTAIFRALLDIAEEAGTKVVLPLHPRTAKMLPGNVEHSVFARLENSRHILRIPPASFLDMIALEKNASLVMTDSGGVQKEAFFFARPCIILRPETEWVEIIEHGAGVLADADYARIREAYRTFAGRKVAFPPLFGDGHAAEKILTALLAY
ncbi:MAG: UDP-N-acetylglucosamine 2-epimerase (non-hydrolyzing) [Bacteroidales bacterium]|nr:UDP-N-acetylglucosamine 2-epimerase (non-hydrolyzing) [Bacteroidales bacterium]